MSASAATLSLPATLDTSAAVPLRHDLLAQIERGESLRLDGAEVTRVGQACLQVLVSARSTAIARNLDFRIDRPSEALERMMIVARLDTALEPTCGA